MTNLIDITPFIPYRASIESFDKAVAQLTGKDDPQTLAELIADRDAARAAYAEARRARRCRRAT